ncbi:MAG: methyltransferase [Paracoccaceae bacterium]|jgi:16S rRNA (guanine1207-N2)-methyltransferase|nr:methyltransferase [Paracoccaceae bacterium]MDG1802305.1 methyltransferase [Paracoccaceae bacterium]MDG2451544.1 methyltransferase [Paracoccaceae bacterium]
MTVSRLTLAADDGLIAIPSSGTIAVYRPDAALDLSALPRDRTIVVHSFRPIHDLWKGRGWTVAAQDAPEATMSIVALPRSKAHARAMIAEACAKTDGVVVVDGQKTEGIDSLYKDVRKRVSVVATLTKAHGRLFAFTASDGFADWADAPTKVEEFTTKPGVFSAEKLDQGSKALVAALPDKLPKQVADLGAGWGYLSQRILAIQGIETLDLVEAEERALDCARLNVTDPRARFHWEDATTHAPSEPYQMVVMNPPFHTGRSGDPDIGRGFIMAAARMLTPQGRLLMVANRHLPYEAVLSERFKVVDELGGTPGFKVLMASRPSRVKG